MYTCALQYMDLNSVRLCIGWLTWVVTSVSGHGSKSNYFVYFQKDHDHDVYLYIRRTEVLLLFSVTIAIPPRIDLNIKIKIWIEIIIFQNHLWRSRLLCLQVTLSGCSGVDKAVQVKLMSLPSWTKTSLSPWILA